MAVNDTNSTFAGTHPDLAAQLVSRVRAALWAMLGALVVLNIVDIFINPIQLTEHYVIRIISAAMMVLGLVAMRQPRVVAQPIRMGLLVHAFGCALSASSAIVGDQTILSMLLCTTITLMAAVVFPWGELGQLVAVVVAITAMALNSYVLIGSLAALASYSAAAMSMTLVVSVFIAGDLRRYRQRLVTENSERRRAASAAVQEGEISAAISRLGHTLISAPVLHSQQLLNILCQETADILGCDTSYTLLWDMKLAAFGIVAGHGSRPEELEWARIVSVPRAQVAELLQRLENDDVAELNSDPYAPNRTSPCLCMALRRGSDIIGLQTAGMRDAGYAFSRKQLRISRGIAQLASLALHNAQLIDEVERANEIKADFIATMSHELRTPLHIIIGYNDLIREGMLGPLTADQVDGLARVHNSAARLLELISMTLDLGRLDDSSLPITFEDVDPKRMLHDLELDTHSLAKPGVEMVWKIATGLPAIHTDASKLKVVLKNLITNAFKFTERGSVMVTASAGGDEVEFKVVDTGIGIPADVREAIFEPSRNGTASVSAGFDATGLGLQIAQRLADLLGARISLDSELGRGSVFCVRLPISTSASGGFEGRSQVVDISVPRGLKRARAAKTSDASPGQSGVAVNS